MNKVILFDGDCNFCNQSVQFIIKRDPNAIFSFASLQSSIGEKYIDNCKISQGENSIILIENDCWYSKSTAALRISSSLNGLWKYFSILLFIPKPIRDTAYHFIAKNRHKLSKKEQKCALPSEEISKRFLA